MKPTIGAIVHYQSYGTAEGEYQSCARAAVITAVSVNNYVSLFVMNPEGIFLNQNVCFSEEPKAGHWSWPPKV